MMGLTSRMAQNTQMMGRQNKSKEAQKPKLEDYIKRRDFMGSTTLLKFNLQTITEEDENYRMSLLWLGYSCFHLGDYQGALNAYNKLLDTGDDPELHLYIACCQYYLRQYAEAKKSAAKGPACPLQNRVLFHIAHKMNDETVLMVYHQKLTDTKDDQLCLAAIHYLRSHFQEATDIYKRLLLDDRVDLALNLYVAMCYYKLDYYDVSLEILAVYLQSHPDSVFATNLKACNHFRLYNGKAAEAELKVLTDQGYNIQDNDLIRHNLVVFQDGNDALQVFPPLMNFIPEARLNLVIYYLRHNQIEEALELVKDVEPSTPSEYIMKAVVNASVGQATGSRDYVKAAQQYFQLVGASASECDTIPGRQCMASCFFLLKQFEDVNIYLSSIKSYLYNDDAFNWNYGIALASVGNFKEAEDTLLLVQDETSRADPCFLHWMARCHINNGKPRLAWELYVKMDASGESFDLLQLIANDCYKAGHFFYAAKAMDVLERLDPDPEYWEGKRGACVGVFQQVIAGKEPKERLSDVLGLLANGSPQAQYITRIMTKWAEQNGVAV